MDAKTTFVVVNFNGKELLPTCIRSIIQQEPGIPIIVVDNASTDGSEELLRNEFPEVRLLRNESNLGFAQAANIGAAEATTQYVAFVNTDVTLEPDWLHIIEEVFETDPETACVASRMLNENGELIDYDGGTLNFYGFGQQVGFGSPIVVFEKRKPESERDRISETVFASGGAMATKRDVFVEVGGFDNSFFAYFEDVDLGYRLWASGHRVVLARDAVAYHRHHGTSSRFLSEASMAFLAEKNALTFLLKSFEAENLAKLLPASLFMNAARQLARLGSGAPCAREFYEAANGSAESSLEFLNELRGELSLSAESIAGPMAAIYVASHLDEIIQARRECQSMRRRSDAEILSRFPGLFFPSYFESGYFRIERSLIDALDLTGLLGDEGKQASFDVQLAALNDRLYEEIDRLQVSRAADRKHIEGLEAALGDRESEATGARRRTLEEELDVALKAVSEMGRQIEDRDEVLAEKESVISDAFASLKDRDARLGNAERIVLEKEELVKTFEALAEDRKQQVIALEQGLNSRDDRIRELEQSQERLRDERGSLEKELSDVSTERDALASHLKRIESTFAYKLYAGLKRALRGLLPRGGRGRA